MQCHAEIEINSTPDVVWGVLTEASGWPEWDSNVKNIEGQMTLGETIVIHTEMSSRAFPVKVTTFDPGHKLEFSWAMPLGMFQGVRTFTIERTKSGTVKFATTEVFSGWMVGIIGLMIPELSASFEQFVEGLKNQVESLNPVLVA